MIDDQLFIGGGWVSSAARYANTSGAAITAVSDLATGEALADEYSLILSLVGGGTGTVTVNTASPNNPYKGRVVAGVPLDGATVNKNIIPGIGIVFSGASANGNAGTVYVGLYLGAFDAFGVDAGTPFAVTRHRVVNTGSGPVSNALASLKTHAVMVKMVGNALSKVMPFADGATEKETGDRTTAYTLTISAVAGSGGGKTCTLSVDGVAVPAAQLADLNAGVNVSGTGLKAIAGQSYRFNAPHALVGLEFSINPICANGDEANVLTFNVRHIQLAREVAGAPDAADWGTDAVTLTQSGQPAGTIQPAGEAFFYTRVVVPSGASPNKNPHPANVALTATETGSAEWTA